MKKITFYDMEIAPNRAMVGFLDLKSGKVKQFEHDESAAIEKYIKKRTLVGFNSRNYDDILLTHMIADVDVKELYEISKEIIDGDGKRWNYYVGVDSIDLMEVAPGQAGLKLYGARLGVDKLQDLPYDPHTKHTKKMWKKVKKYNVNDLILTKALYDKLLPQLKLRKRIGKQYDIEVMSRSDAQIAEDIFKVELKKVGVDAKAAGKKKSKPKSVRYKAPAAVKFKSDHLKAFVKRLEKTSFELNGMGSPVMPEWLKDHIVSVANVPYKVGMGGLHSMESEQAVTGKLGNIDVASYYPALIITLSLFPPQLGKEFLKIYTKIRDTRVKAKRSGDKVTADTLKIVLNGSFGKYGSIYSFLYAPELLLTITITGQLYLLMLIERLTDAGIVVISSNTDGIEYVRSKMKKVKTIVKQWEKETGMEMEFGEYNGLYSRDVNSYIAVYDGYTKRKGFFAEESLAKNPEHNVVQDAIAQFLLDGTPIEKYIKGCKDVKKFLTARTVRGGALWSDKEYPNTEEYETYIKRVPFKRNMALEKRNEKYQIGFILADADDLYLGKVVRYYYAKDGKPMYYKQSGNRVPKTEGCKPMMDLSHSIPDDLDYDKYIELAYKYLEGVGYE